MVATDFSHLQFHAVRSKKKLAVLDSCEIISQILSFQPSQQLTSDVRYSGEILKLAAI